MSNPPCTPNASGGVGPGKPIGPVSVTVVENHLGGLLRSMLAHDGYGELRVESRILKRGQKEVILHFGHQYRFVVDTLPEPGKPSGPGWQVPEAVSTGGDTRSETGSA